MSTAPPAVERRSLRLSSLVPIAWWSSAPSGAPPPPDADPDLDRVAVDLGDAGATLLGAVMDDPLRHDLRRLAELNALTGDAELAPVLERHRIARGREAYRTVRYVAVAPEDGTELARTAMQVFRANHGSLLRTLGDPDLQVMHRLLGSDSPLQGELLSYLLFDPDFFAAASAFGHRDALRWVEQHPDLWRTDSASCPDELAPINRVHARSVAAAAIDGRHGRAEAFDAAPV